MKKEIVISVNSPGEIAGWMKPAVREIKKARKTRKKVKAKAFQKVTVTASSNNLLIT